MPQTQTPMVKLKNFFGYLPGETLGQFNEEIKKLTQADKDELIAMIDELETA